MPFADTTLRDEYAAAVERVAGRVLDALRGAGDPAAPTRRSAPGAAGPAHAAPEGPLPAEGPLSRAESAAVRVLGPDLFAAQLLAGLPLDGPTADAAAEALETFPMGGASPAPGSAAAAGPDATGAALANAWRDRTTAQLVALAGRPGPVPGPDPLRPPEPTPGDWPRWSVDMARLSALALPRLDGPVHELARRHSLTLARGVVRSMLRRDYRTAARLARWLAWTEADGAAAHLDLGPVLDRIRAVGDGSTRMWLELAITEALAGPGTTASTASPTAASTPSAGAPGRTAGPPDHGPDGDSPDGAAA
ncbi:hypothetical protein ACFVVL_07350 [Kitasatospora sp. NPDC058115]|uniref:hypothetical protein n=1 Tax=Kitasatospora sp. NPDC058115 TaxID=3346347 RepID=UPI0036DAA6EA